MTRPKRRTPPSTPKSVSFEIPASLHQFSTISRSLATTMATASLAGSESGYHNYTTDTYTGSQASPGHNAPPRPKSQSSTHSATTLSSTPTSAQYATSKSIPQKRSFSEYRPSTQPVMDAEQSSTLAEVVAKARAAVASSKSQSPQAPRASIQPSGARYLSTSDPNSVAQIAARQREDSARAKAAQNAPPPIYIPEEPPLRIGEAPTLTTHPHLIAQMIARKRADAEQLGHRKRWARQQQEYRMSESPGAHLTHELNIQVSLDDVDQYQSSSISNLLPVQSTPDIPALKPPTPIIFNAQLPPTQHPAGSLFRTQNPPAASTNTQTPTMRTPAAETVSRPASSNAARSGAANNERQSSSNIERHSSNHNNSLFRFESPFSSPIVEFLEKATDSAGLREVLEPNQVASTRTSLSGPAAPAAQSGDDGTTTTSTPADSNTRSQTHSEIPPLFSDKPRSSQPQPDGSTTAPSQIQGEPPTQHFLFHASTSLPAQASQSQPQFGVLRPQPDPHPQMGVLRPQLAPRQPPAPRPVPYYPQQAGMPGYYRVETPHNWLSGGNFVPHPTSTAPSPNAHQPVPPAHLGMGYNGYAMPVGPVYAYAMPQPGLAPPPGPLQTYGTVAAAAPTDQQKPQATSGDYLTAADLVAGINTKFKHATKRGFSVPKR